MRMFEWESDMVRFMRDASEHTEYHGRLADCIVDAAGGPQRAASMHVCDAGCGLGYLSLALAARFAQVTAVDIAEEPLSVLRENAARRCISNLTVCRADMRRLPEEMHFDVVVFCLFGSAEEAIAMARGRAEQIILIQKSARDRCFSLGREDGAAAGKAGGQSGCSGVQCDVRSVTLRLDQPIRSVEDGIRFFTLYGCRDGEAQVTRGEALLRMQATGDSEFPYIIPAQRRLSILRMIPQFSG